MGLPIRKLILASNENDVLDEFFRTGHYRVRKNVQETSSPSMDISKASNFERYVFDLVGRDGARVKELYRRLDAQGEFELPPTNTAFVSGRSTHADRLRTIKQVYDKFGVMIDPHTADEVQVAMEKREAGDAPICLETAPPATSAAPLPHA